MAAVLTAAAGLGCGFAPAQTVTPAEQSKIVVTMPPVPLLPRTVGPSTAPLTADPVVRAKAAEVKDTSFAANCLPALEPTTARTGVWPECVAMLKEDALLRASAATYHPAKGAGVIQAAALEFDDATGAYSAYTFVRASMHNPRVSTSDVKALLSSTETSTDATSTTVWAGTVVLHVDGHPTPAQMTALVSSLPKASGRKSLAPLLPTFFPNDGLDRTSIGYALGPAGYRNLLLLRGTNSSAGAGGALPENSIDWKRAVEVGVASYGGRGGKGELTLLMSPTPQIAGDQGRAIEKALNALPKEERMSRFGTIKLRRIGPLVGLATGSFTPDRAEALVQALKLNEVVTFDKKMPLEFHAEVKKTASLLENIATFVGVLIAASILLALFLGGARAGWRKMRGKPVYSEPEFLAINLRGQPKPLAASTAEPVVKTPAAGKEEPPA